MIVMLFQLDSDKTNRTLSNVIGVCDNSYVITFRCSSAIHICPCCVFQVAYYRTREPLVLPADGSMDSHYRSVLCSQTSAAGPAYFCPGLSAPFLLCNEHPGGGSSQTPLLSN